MPESTFLSAYSETLGKETARQVYTNAINNHIRNEQALITMREAVRGTGLAIIDGQQPLETRIKTLQAVADRQEVPVPLNLEELFGSMDYCECEECTSVYSPASYFVEILQFLRNNNLDPDKPNTPLSGVVQARRRQSHYAKDFEGRERALSVQRLFHNWVRPHWELSKQTTPAMAMGLFHRPVKMEELLFWKGFLPTTP